MKMKNSATGVFIALTQSKWVRPALMILVILGLFGCNGCDESNDSVSNDSGHHDNHRR